MLNFQVLQSNRNIIARLGLTTSRFSNDPANTLLTTILTYYSLFISFVFGFLSVLLLIYINFDDLKFVLDASMMAIGVPQLLGVYLSVWLNRDKVDNLQLKLQEIIDKGNFEKSRL